MDYTSEPLLFRVRKAMRYVSLYGVRRTLVKIRGRYHMNKVYSSLPARERPGQSRGKVGLIGCGNFGFSVIAYYLKKNFGYVIRGCMDIDINRAASLFEQYKVGYYTDDAEEIFADPDIKLVYIASNHASHAEYAIRALRAGKDVHIEKPHIVDDDQLNRLCEEVSRNDGRIVSIGFNRPHSAIGMRIRDLIAQEDGDLLQNWFVAGHKIAPGHWYHGEKEGGRVLGNLCHWADFTYQVMPPERRFPILITPTRSERPDCDLAVTYVFGDGSIGAIAFSEKGEPFEGVRERYAAHRGNVLIAMDDFKRLVADIGPSRKVWERWHRDHGHEGSVVRSYETSMDSAAPGCDISYVWEAGQLFLRTKQALDTSQPVSIDGWNGNP